MEQREAIRVVSAEIQRGGRYLITRRPDHAVLPGLWEFPGGRVRDGESEAEALARALRARIGCAVRVGERLLQVRHEDPERVVILVVYRCALEGAEPVCGTVAELAWVPPEELSDYAFPDADARTVRLLAEAAD